MNIMKMSTLGSGNNTINMNTTPTFHEFKKQASFFLKEKIKTARLALTDVTPAQLLVEEATNGNPGGPDARTLKMISKAAFEVDDYWRIVGILHKRLARFDKRDWRASYKALIVLEYLLTHGPESVAQEFQKEIDVIAQMERFQHVDEKGFNWGLNVRKKCERILKLLSQGPLLKEERERARKISRGIEGFGSFCLRSSSDQESSLKTFERSHSHFIDPSNLEEFTLNSNETDSIHTNPDMNTKEGILREGGVTVESSKPLLSEHRDELTRVNTFMGDHHSFDDSEGLTCQSLLSTT